MGGRFLQLLGGVVKEVRPAGTATPMQGMITGAARAHGHTDGAALARRWGVGFYRAGRSSGKGYGWVGSNPC